MRFLHFWWSVDKKGCDIYSARIEWQTPSRFQAWPVFYSSSNAVMLFYPLIEQTKFLSLRSRIELDEMVNHPLFAIVFQMQYILNVPVIQPELPSGKKARSRVIEIN